MHRKPYGSNKLSNENRYRLGSFQFIYIYIYIYIYTHTHTHIFKEKKKEENPLSLDSTSFGTAYSQF